MSALVRLTRTEPDETRDPAASEREPATAMREALRVAATGVA
ncbi:MULTISPECIES: hypothetical protein [unclassified Streptomyces]|nr:hypothetical protein [Streptomyces sp. SJL17-1]